MVRVNIEEEGEYQVIEYVMVHVETTQWKLHVRVDLDAEIKVPPKSLQM